MTTRSVIPVVLVVLVLASGCSQLASAPNSGPETTAAANASANATNASANTTNSIQTPTATATPSSTARARTATGTAPPTTATTPAASSTPQSTKTKTASPTAIRTRTATATPTATSTATPTPEAKYVVIIGGKPDDKVRYRMTVTGSIERRGESYGAPIDDKDVTEDPDIDKINGSSVSGRLGGGGDAYRITGTITSFEAEGDVTVYVDGEKTDLGS